MKKQVKNLFALFLTASMAVTLVPADAFAAVHDAVKDATTTTAYEKVEAERKAAQPKEGSAEAAIQKALYTNTDEVDLSEYNLTEKKAEKLTDKSLGDNKDTDLVDVTYDTDKNGKVTTMSVEKDDTYAYALEEIDELAADDAGTGSDEVTQEEVGKAYQDLMEFYEANPDYLGLATPYFTSKDTDGGPVSSLLSLMQQKIYKDGDPDDEKPENNSVTYKDMYDVIQGYQTTLQYGIQIFGQQLLDAKKEALAQLDDSMTREQKLLVLNDWLGKYCTFDMGSIQEEQDKKNQAQTTDAAIQSMGETAAVALAEDDGQQQPTEEQIAYLKNMLLNGDLKTAFESTAFGALVRRNTICAGYTSAYTYLVQCAFPEIYKNADGSWKTAKEVNEGIVSSEDKKDDNTSAASEEDSSEDKKDETTETKPTYMVDFTKIFWRSDVQMLGKAQTFRNSHYFNAVKTDTSDNWYYVDSCYNDIYIECMGRNRVETDGNMTHNYFLVSYTNLADRFEGNFDEIDTLHKDNATDEKYEDAWFTDAQGPINFDKDNWYYVQNTTSYSSNMTASDQKPDQLVSMPRTAGATDSSDKATILVDYEEGTGEVKEGAKLLTESATKDENVNDKIYPGLIHTSAYYNGALYLNADNQIFKYDLSTNAITKVKEYNEVSAKSVADSTGTGINNNFTGMTFKVTSKDDKDAIHTVENHPIAGLTIDSDGNLKVDIATTYCYVDKYKTEQTNYNSGYSNYKYKGNTIKRGGSNDNQEFMWSADFVDTQSMKDITGEDHTHEYETVTVAPTCENNGFTEERCKTCGVVKEGSKTESEDAKATGHHYVKYKDETYTKESDAKDAKNVVVDAIVCTDCMKAIPRKSSGNGNMFTGDDSDELEDVPADTSTEHTYKATTTWNDDHSAATMTVKCDHCEGKELDFLTEDNVTPAKDAKAEVTAEYAKDGDGEDAEAGNCEKGGDVTYTAKLEVAGKTFTDTQKETVAGNTAHNYVPTFTWDEENHTAKVSFKCSRGDTEATEPVDATVTKDEDASTKATCEVDGKDVYVATATDANKKEHKDTLNVKLAAIGHDYQEPTYEWADDFKTCKAKFVCKNDETHVKEVDCTVTPETTDATCTTDGKIVYTATCKFNDKEYTCPETKEATIKATGHTYGEPTYEWSEDNKTCTATFKCEKDDDTQTLDCTVTSKTTEATCTTEGSITYTATVKDPNGKEYTTEKTEKTADALGHAYKEPTYAWSEDNKTCTATFVCEKGDDTKDVDCTVTSKTADPTCTEAGSVTYTATVKDPNGKEYTTDKTVAGDAATGHTYGEPTYEWSEDNKTCKAVFKCEKGDDTKELDCTVTSKTDDATCTKEGAVTYTATVTGPDGKEYTTEKTVKTTDALGHEYGEPTFGEWTEKDGKWTCEATFTCKHDSSHVEKVECTVTSEGKEATCTEAGSVTYTATVTVPGGTQTYTNPEKKEVKGEALGHKYGDATYKWSEDNKVCTATFTCERCGDKHEENCDVKAETTDASYTAAGKVVYTATCKFEGKDYSTTKEVKVGQKDSKAKFAKSSYSLYSSQSGKVSLVSDYKQDGIVSIKSSNPSKLSVSASGALKAGVVKGKAVKVTITAVVKSGKTIKTVVTVAPTKVTLNATSVPLQLKKSTTAIKVAKTTLPGDQVSSWSTSNKKVVVVSRTGKITAKKLGTAVVTVTMKSGATAKCKVKVQKTAVRLSKVTTNTKKVTLNLKKGPKTYQLTATKTPVTVVDKVTFTTSNKKVAVVSKTGKITAKKAGKAVITVKCAKKVQKVTVVVKAK